MCGVLYTILLVRLYARAVSGKLQEYRDYRPAIRHCERLQLHFLGCSVQIRGKSTLAFRN